MPHLDPIADTSTSGVDKGSSLFSDTWSKNFTLITSQIKQQLPPGIELVDAPDFLEWKMDLRVLDTNPLYQNQTYRLRLRFNGKYPIEPPEVVFIQEKAPLRPIPMHPHVYSKFVTLG